MCHFWPHVGAQPTLDKQDTGKSNFKFASKRLSLKPACWPPYISTNCTKRARNWPKILQWFESFPELKRGWTKIAQYVCKSSSRPFHRFTMIVESRGSVQGIESGKIKWKTSFFPITSFQRFDLDHLFQSATTAELWLGDQVLFCGVIQTWKTYFWQFALTKECCCSSAALALPLSMNRWLLLAGNLSEVQNKYNVFTLILRVWFALYCACLWVFQFFWISCSSQSYIFG